jgi:threonine/homoserine/homoserine lactone efflux protein
MTWNVLVVFIPVYAIAVATPGPAIVAVVARSLASGFGAAIPMTLGMLAGDLVLMALSAFGLALVAQSMGELFFAVKIAGALYLVWLGWKYWTAPIEELLPESANATRGFLAQFALTLGNPKAIAFFVALLPTVVDLSKITVLGYLQLAAVSCFVLPAVTLTYAALASRARGLFASVVARRRINRSAAVVMVGAGVGVAMS